MVADNLLSMISLRDGGAWYEFPKTRPKVGSNYGLQMAVLGDYIVGIGTARDNSLFSVKMTKDPNEKDASWSSVTKLPSIYKALGRVSVTSASIDDTNDRVYVAYRGTNDRVYLIYTNDLEKWTDLGRVGSEYAKTKVAPAICTVSAGLFHEDLMLTGAGEDKYIYYTVVDFDGKREVPWTKIPGTGTQSALALISVGRTCYLFHTAYNNKAFFYQYLEYDDKWSELEKVDAPSISSGVSVVRTRNRFSVTYRGTFDGTEGAVMNSRQDSRGWVPEQPIYWGTMFYQTGMCEDETYPRLSIPVDSEGEDSIPYRKPMMMMKMSDNAVALPDKEAKEWECKWQEQEQGPSKGMLANFFCC